MKFSFGHWKNLFSAAAALLCALTLFACGSQTPPQEQKPNPPVNPPVQEMTEVDLTEFLARVYNRNAPNFTANIDISDGDKTDGIKLVYDAKVGYGVTAKDEEIVYSDGLLFKKADKEQTGGLKTADEEQWLAEESDAFFEFKTIKQRNLEAVLELLLPYLGVDTESEVDIIGREYVLQLEKDSAETLNGLLAIAKENIDEKAIVGITKAWNYLNGSELTQDEFEALFVFYGDSTFKELLKAGKPISEEALVATYTLIKSLLADSYKLPSFYELKNKYGDLTLSGIIGLGSAQDTAAMWKEQTLRERLEKYPYTDATVADFVASDAPTEFTVSKTVSAFRADPSFALTTAKFTQSIKIKDAPVFSESLIGGGIKTEIKEYSVEKVINCAFENIGKSIVKVPEDYAVVGEERITVNCAGKYTIKRGTKNKALPNIIVTADGGDGVGGPNLDDSKEWVELLKRICDGLTLDNEAGTLSVSADSYNGMKAAVKEGLITLKIKAYEEFDFILNVK